MRGRRLIAETLAIATVVAAMTAGAQSSARLPRIAVLEPGAAPGGGCLSGFRQGLGDFGYREGETVAINYHFGNGNPGRVSTLVADIVRQAPDVIWTHSPIAAQAARQATSTTPVVVGVAGYLVEQGLAASLARPGGNVTGFELGDIDLAAKRLELLKEAVPAVTRVAVLVDPSLKPYDVVPRNLEREARSLAMSVLRIEAHSPADFDRAFGAMVREGANGLMIADVPLFARNREKLFTLALQHRLPSIAGWRTYAEAGSLLAYGGSVPELCRRSVAHIDKILKGAKAGELPVERPDKFELIVNARTARALGLTLPSSIMIRADEVIQK